jgi:hypothetical protein
VVAALLAAGTTMATIGSSAAQARVAPRGPAGVVVTPSTGLADGQAVDVSASGLSNNAPVVIGQCAVIPTPDPGHCDALNFANAVSTATGTVDASYTVHRAFTTGNGGLVDCGVTACEILVVDLGAPTINFLHGVISFAPGGPQAGVTVTPATGLADHQTVTVNGTGFTGSQPIIGVLECLTADEAAGCTLISGSLTIIPAADGSFSADVIVQRILHASDGSRVDCVNGGCELVAFDINNASYNARAAIAFDATLPPPPAPAITVMPNSGLPFHAPVTITGAGWTPQDFVDLIECGSGADDPCSFTAETAGFVDSTGGFSAPLTVHRMIGDPFSGGAPLDCASAPGRCVVVAFDVFTGDMTQTPISFDPNAPIPPTPIVRTTATHGIADRQPIRFEVSRLTPNAAIDLSMCASTETTISCIGIGGFPLSMANGAGRFNTTVIAHRWFAAGFESAQPGRVQLRAHAIALAAFLSKPGTTARRLASQRVAANHARGPWTWRANAANNANVDCASARVECDIEFESAADDFFATVPFSIDASKTPGENAKVTATPSTGLSDGAQIAVDTKSTSYGAFMGQCALDGDLIIACGDILPLAPDRIGHTHTVVTVQRRLPSFTGDGTVDCRVHRCAILYSPGLGSNDILAAPISFKG